MHPRITVHESVLPRDLGPDDLPSAFAATSATRIGVRTRRIARAEDRATFTAAGLTIAYTVQDPLFVLADRTGWPDSQTAAIAALDAAAAAGATCVYATTGPALGMAWEAAAAAFVEACEPIARHASTVGIPLLIEPTNSLFAAFGFVHTLRDTVDVARDAGIGVCLDVQHCWSERGLHETIRDGAEMLALVQVSDQLPTRREPYRAVPGDGIIPLRQILDWLLDAGYRGPIDLELYPEADVPTADTIGRAAERVGTLLDQLGA